MRPSGRTVQVAYQRLYVIGAAWLQDRTAGSNKSTSVSPNPLVRSHPPSVMNRPSGRNVCPAHRRSTHGFGTEVNNPVTGSQTLAVGPVCQVSTLPVFRRCTGIGIAGHGRTLDH